MKKQNKWTIAIVSALIGIGACTTSVQAADTTSDVSTNQSTSATTSYSKADYFSRNPKIIRVKHSTPAYSDAALTNSVRTARSGEHFLVQSLITPNCKAPVVRTTTGLYFYQQKQVCLLQSRVTKIQRATIKFTTLKLSPMVRSATICTAAMKELRLGKS
nr:hypothetical protein [Lactobacillus amylovorus]